MKILSMTATFGKLEHQTLQLHDGLNVIQAPNEWGKSTWSAFIVAMLYGISTSSRTRKDFLADKERYAPWGGKPMSGRMEILWQGRCITLERSALGKIPFGRFRAYETHTNVELPELTGENCGQVLLGVEREVFTRAGFLRFSDLPVAPDEALRRRLNALVTTGDETGAADALAQKLKKLKNECRHNKTGLIPQAEKQRDQLLEQVTRLEKLQEQLLQLQAQQAQLEKDIALMENHQATLEYQDAMQAQIHIAEAERSLAVARERWNSWQAQWKGLPEYTTAQEKIQQLQQLRRQLSQLQREEDSCPPLPEMPEMPEYFAGKAPEQILRQAEQDHLRYEKLCKPKPALLIFAILLAVIAGAGFFFGKWFVAAPVLAVALILGLLWLVQNGKRKEKRKALDESYGNLPPDSWVEFARSCTRQLTDYEQLHQLRQRQMETYRQRAQQLQQQLLAHTDGMEPEDFLIHWQEVIRQRRQGEEARQLYLQASHHGETVRKLARTVPKPTQPDWLALTEEETAQALHNARLGRQQLQQQIGQCQGQMEALGDKAALTRQLEAVQERIAKLEQYNGALTLSLDTLAQATTELQRRFAPRISARARELFGKLTGQRYDRLLLDKDLSVEVAAGDEDVTHGVLWRSDGTVDQLYLALRLAVAEALTPDAPLVLDDAMVRFDETRLAAAMEILKDYAKEKQVILFTCHDREAKFVE